MVSSLYAAITCARSSSHPVDAICCNSAVCSCSAIVGLLDQEKDARIDLNNLSCDNLNPIVH